MRMKIGNGMPYITALCCACVPLPAHSSADVLVIHPAAPTTYDPIRVDVPVRTCVAAEDSPSVTTATSQVTRNVIALAVEQKDASSCLASGDGVAIKTFTFLIQPLTQGSYTVNFTRAIGQTVDLQRSSTFFVSAPLGGN